MFIRNQSIYYLRSRNGSLDIHEFPNGISIWFIQGAITMVSLSRSRTCLTAIFTVCDSPVVHHNRVKHLLDLFTSIHVFKLRVTTNIRLINKYLEWKYENPQRLEQSKYLIQGHLYSFKCTQKIDKKFWLDHDASDWKYGEWFMTKNYWPSSLIKDLFTYLWHCVVARHFTHTVKNLELINICKLILVQHDNNQSHLYQS